MILTKYIGSAREKADKLEIKRDLLEIMKIGARMNLHTKNPKVTKLLKEIKNDYDKI